MTSTRAPNCNPLILVVEDDLAQRLLTRECLEQAGYAVEEAENGHEGLRKIESTRPDLVVSDALMPQLDGFELCRRVRADLNLAHIPILMVTALGEADSVERAFDVGATDFITKPINWSLLAYRVRYMLRASRMEAEMREAKDAAESASVAKTHFLANMSHELRTPLNAVIGFSEIMISEAFGPLGNAQYRSYADDIHQSGVHLLQIINDILDLSKAEVGHLELIEDVVDLAETIQAALRLVATRSEAGGLTISVACPGDLPSFYGDQLKLRQILVNLLSNAVKFTPPGGRIGVAATIDSAGQLTITVNDTGIGIAKDDIAKAFEPFRQIDSGLNRRYEGTGLGLPLTAAMVSLHGGTIALDSEVGAGTRVTLTFPRSRVMAVPAAAE